MLTDEEVAAEATTITAVRQSLLVMELRRAPSCVANPALYPGLADVVAAAADEQAQILNAGLRKLQALGSKSTKLRSQDIGLDTDKERDRNIMREWLLAGLFESPVPQPLSAAGQIPDPAGISCACGCWPCSCGGYSCLS